MIFRRLMAAAKTLAAIFIVVLSASGAGAQSLSVLPVNIWFQPGQRATILTVTNHGTSQTAIQIRAYNWNQPSGDDQLTSSDILVASPPLATIAPGESQVVRLILRQPPMGREATYRILVDQIPPPAEPGVVHVVLRLSIPIFALPMTRAVPIVKYHIEINAGQLYLIGVNEGRRHEAVRDITLGTSDGLKLKEESGASPYILAGSTRRWHIPLQGSLPLAGETLKLIGHADSGAVEQQVRVVAAP